MNRDKYVPMTADAPLTIDSPEISQAVCDEITSNPDLQASLASLQASVAEFKLSPIATGKFPYPVEIRFTPSLVLTTKEAPDPEEPGAPQPGITPVIIKIRYFYPLKREIVKEYEYPQELTQQTLSILICQEYQRLYAEEAKSLKPLPSQRVVNPYKSAHGIWGPGLEEMYLTGVVVESLDEIGIPVYRPLIEDLI